MKPVIKIIAMALIMYMLSAISSYAVDFHSEKDIASYEINMRLLQRLGIIDEEREIAESVKRAEFAKILLAMNGMGDQPDYQNTAFSDVSASSPYSGAIFIATYSGLLHGYSKDIFAPDDNLVYEDAVKAMVRILGYPDEGVDEMIKASTLHLLRGVYGEKGYPITYGSLINLIINTMNTNLVGKALGASGYRILEGRTLLSEKFSLIKKKGVVTSAPQASLYRSGAGVRGLSIDEVFYQCSEDFSSLLGYMVEFYVNDAEEIIYVYESAAHNDILVVDAEDIISYRDRCYTYYQNDRIKNLTIPNACPVLYNGRLLTTAVDMKIRAGSVSFIDNNNDGQYDLVKIMESKTFVVGAIDHENSIIYDKCGVFEHVDFSNSLPNRLTIKNTYGSAVESDTISVGNVITCTQSLDGEITEMILSTAKVSGEIEEVHDNGERLKINDSFYETIRDYFSFDKLEVGAMVTLYLDAAANAVFFEQRTTGLSYGYLVDAAMMNKGLHKQAQFKVFDFDTGTLVIVTAGKTVVIDGESQKNHDEIIALFRQGNASVVPQIIGYQCNANGQITTLDTLAADVGTKKKGLRYLSSATNVEWRAQQGCFRDGVTFTTAATVFIELPEDPKSADEKDFTVLSSGQLSGDGYYTFDAYQCQENILSADFVLMTRASLGLTGIVKKVTQTIDRDFVPMYKLIIATKDAEFTLHSYDEDHVKQVAKLDGGSQTSCITVGDVVKFEYKAVAGANYLKDIKMIFSFDEGYQLNTNPYNQWNANAENFFAGRVYKKEGSIISLVKQDVLDASPEVSFSDLILQSLNYGKIFKAEVVAGKVQIVGGTINDIYDYTNVGENCSSMFIYNRNLNPQFIYIYQ
jgi:hypothetical protein